MSPRISTPIRRIRGVFFIVLFKYSQIPTADKSIKAKERNASAENKEALSTCNASVKASPY